MTEHATRHTPAFTRLEHDIRGFMAASVPAAFAEPDLGTLLPAHGNSLSAAELARLAQADDRTEELPCWN